MKFIKNYIAYLKDNPEGYWFKRKLFGWGWTPATREGWAVTIVFVLAVLITAVRGESVTTDEAVLTEVLLPIIGLIFLFFYVAYVKGEAPKWQWHFPREKSEDAGENIN